MATQRLQVGIGYADQGDRHIIRAIVESLGHEIVLEAGTANELECSQPEHCPEIMVVGPDLDDGSSFELVNRLGRKSDCPIVAIIHKQDFDRAQRLFHDDIMGVLVEPVTKDHLRPALFLARKRFLQVKRLEREQGDLLYELGQPMLNESRNND